MEYHSPRSQAATAAKNWCEQYRGDLNSTLFNGKNKQEILDDLLSLGESPNPQEVNQVIGNNGWTNCKCDECGSCVPATVTLGQTPDYESNTASICQLCLEKALDLCRHEKARLPK